MPDNNNFNVLDMVEEVAADQNIDAAELFAKPETPTAEIKEAPIEEQQIETKEEPKKKKEWVPDESLTADMPELHQSTGVVYDAKDVKLEEDTTLRNLSDDDAVSASNDSMDMRDRQFANVRDAMKRNNIVYFQIPDDHLDGATYHARIMTAAGDRNYQKGQNELDAIYAEIEKLHPEWVHKLEQSDATFAGEERSIFDLPTNDDFPTVKEVPISNTVTIDDELEDEPPAPVIDTTTVTIDKTQLPQITWSPEELDKIKKSRTIELKIVESSPIEFSSIKEADTNVIDSIIDTYVRKTNDNVGTLPASQYRATFTGLSYAEVLDLSTSQDMNNLDGERSKWSICFNHMKNQSIGAWESYVLYIDPETGSEKRVDSTIDVPENVDPDTVHRVTKFEDFLRKTSYLDLEFMLWKILCATAMSKEIITITCRAKIGDNQCNNEYDWVYNPAELLQVNSVDPAILEEMKKTGEAKTFEEIKAQYMASPVMSNNTVKLPNSGLIVVYGHVSAYEYLNSLYELSHDLANKEEHDASDISTMLAYRAMLVTKMFLIPNGDGSYSKVSTVDGMLKIFNTLDEVDWQVVEQLTDMMTTPYALQYAMRDVKCPKCGNVTSIPINSMRRMLFILTQSLNSVNVSLKKI